MIDYTTNELIEDIKQRASVPTSQSLFNEDRFVRFLSSKLRDNVVPLMLSVREDYFVTYVDLDVTNLTAETNKYSLPERAIGMKLKDVVLVDDRGNEEQLPRLTYQDKALPGHVDYQSLYGFYVEGNSIRLFVQDSFVGETLRMYYYRRPNALVKTSNAGKILTIDSGTGVVTLDNAPTTWTTATTFDLICGKPPFDSKSDDTAITAIGGFDLTFATIPEGLAVGDWVCEANESVIPQIPYEGFSLLVQLGVVKVLEALNDTRGWQTAVEDYKQMQMDVKTMLSPRVDEATLKTVSRNGVWRNGGSNKWGR